VHEALEQSDFAGGVLMSIIGILSSNLFASGAAQNTQSTEGNTPSKFQQLKTEFQQLGQDLQSGNLTQAQQDYATLSQNLPGGQAGTNPLLQAFAQLGQDLQANNLQAAQQDYGTLQQDAQQQAAQVGGHHGHHHHHAENTSSSSSTPQQNNPISQAFQTLAQDLQAGNLSGAQSAFATLQNDLQQIGGFVASGPSNTAALTAANLNVSA